MPFVFLRSCLFTASCKAARAAQVPRVARLRRESSSPSPSLPVRERLSSSQMSERSCRTAQRHQSCSDLESSPTISERPQDSSACHFIIFSPFFFTSLPSVMRVVVGHHLLHLVNTLTWSKMVNSLSEFKHFSIPVQPRCSETSEQKWVERSR